MTRQRLLTTAMTVLLLVPSACWAQKASLTTPPIQPANGRVTIYFVPELAFGDENRFGSALVDALGIGRHLFFSVTNPDYNPAITDPTDLRSMPVFYGDKNKHGRAAVINFPRVEADYLQLGVPIATYYTTTNQDVQLIHDVLKQQSSGTLGDFRAHHTQTGLKANNCVTEIPIVLKNVDPTLPRNMDTPMEMKRYYKNHPVPVPDTAAVLN